MYTLRLFLFTLGAGSGVFLPSLPPLWVIALIALAVGGLFWLLYLVRRHRHLAQPALFVLGLCLSMTHLSMLVDKQLPQEYEGVDLPLVVRVADLPELAGRSVRFLAEVVEAPADMNWAETIRLSWYSSAREPAPEIRPGQIWRLTARLKRPRGFSNPQGFDYHAWLLGNGIYATGYVRTRDGHRKLADPDAWSFAAMRYQLLRQLFSRDDGFSRDGGMRHGGLLKALVLGDRSDIEQGQWDVLQATGTIHLMAISGLHVGLVATLGFLLGSGARRIMILAAGSRPSDRLLPIIASVGFAGVYAGLAGFSIPTQRALIFVVLVNLATLLARRVNLYHLLAVCALAIVLFDPFAFLSRGFWLSFSAVLVLFYLFSQRAGRTSGVETTLVAQVALFIGMIAPLCLLALPVSLAGPVANLVAVPVVSLVIIPALFIAVLISGISLSWALAILQFTDTVFGFLWWFLELMASHDAVWWQAPAKIWLALPAGILAALLLLAPRNIPFRIAGAALLLVFIFPSRPAPDGLKLTVLDVGQGLAVVMETPDATLLYDTGARFSDNFDVGSRIVAPYLIAHGSRRLDAIYVSHADNDHAGGLGGIMARLPVDRVASGQRDAVVRQLRKSGTDVEQERVNDCRQGMRWDYGELAIEALWPPADGVSSGVKLKKTNNQSCVLLLRYGQWRILLPGDIEDDVERALVAADHLPNEVDILVAPHHGSRSSSSADFVARLAPEYVIYSAGYKNRYGHPHPEVVERYRRQGSAGYNTGAHGAITFLLNPEGRLDVHYHRETGRRPWYGGD